jgi:hypothetical protein
MLVMSALVHRRTGHSLLTDRPLWFAALFPASAAFWWLFEYLNQFVRNWHYIGIPASGDWDYFLQGTLPFSTVCPPCEHVAWLGSSALQSAALRRYVLIHGRPLTLPAAWPRSPMARGQAPVRGAWLRRSRSLPACRRCCSANYFAPMARGDWRCVVQPALAALSADCFGSCGTWQPADGYSIPFVQRFQLFEMPPSLRRLPAIRRVLRPWWS